MLGLAVGVSLAIMAWIVWSERQVPVTPSADTTPATPASSILRPTLDQAQVAALEAAIKKDPAGRESHVALANAYFRAHSFEEAIPWYERALDMGLGDVESSTNLGMSYFYAGSVERAVEQLDRSLEVVPDHAQTWFSLGIVRAFGLGDLEGAIEAWERVIKVAPDGPEARAAREALTRVPSELGAVSWGSPSPEQP